MGTDSTRAAGPGDRDSVPFKSRYRDQVRVNEAGATYWDRIYPDVNKCIMKLG